MPKLFSMRHNAKAPPHRNTSSGYMDIALAGLLARGSTVFHRLPSPCGPVAYREKLAAYSCEGSHGFDPFWVIRTVFPFNPRIWRNRKRDLYGLIQMRVQAHSSTIYLHRAESAAN